MSNIGKLIQGAAVNMKPPTQQLQQLGDYAEAGRAWTGPQGITTIAVQKIKNGFIIFNSNGGDVYYCKDAEEISQRFITLLVESKLTE